MKTTGIIKAIKLKKHNFPEDIIRQFEHIKDSKDGWLNKKSRYIEKMDALLTEEQRLLLWEHGGNCTRGETGIQSKILATELAGKPLHEKIEIANKTPHIYKHHLNKDGTITAYCYCHCLQNRYKNPESAKQPSSYGCAAGAAFHNLKLALGVNAKILSIDYPQESDGKKDMAFTFEVIK